MLCGSMRGSLSEDIQQGCNALQRLRICAWEEQEGGVSLVQQAVRQILRILRIQLWIRRIRRSDSTCGWQAWQALWRQEGALPGGQWAGRQGRAAAT